MIVKAFTKSYGDFTLSVPQLSFSKNKIYALIGTNGCGKSSFAKVVSGIVSSDGDIKVFEEKAGYMPQQSFAFRMSVKKNVMLNTKDEAEADRLIDLLGLGGHADKNAKKLSGGQTARMALARALAGRYDMLILDEPTASMDMRSCLSAERCIRDYANKGSCVLLITHSINQAKRIADEILYMEGGQLIESGPAAQLLAAPKNAKTAAFIEFYSL